MAIQQGSLIRAASGSYTGTANARSEYDERPDTSKTILLNFAPDIFIISHTGYTIDYDEIVNGTRITVRTYYINGPCIFVRPATEAFCGNIRYNITGYNTDDVAYATITWSGDNVILDPIFNKQGITYYWKAIG